MHDRTSDTIGLFKLIKDRLSDIFLIAKQNGAAQREPVLKLLAL